MKLGEIKAEALSLMFADISILEDEKNLNSELNRLSCDPNYSYYFGGMPGAINRCFASLENKGILPTKTTEIKSDDKKIQNCGIMKKIDFNDIGNVFAVERVSFYDDKRYIDLADYSLQGSCAIIFKPLGIGTYVIEYTPKIKRIKSTTGANENIDLPDDIACLIPYFIKSELFREDDASEASVSRNIYESMCDELYDRKTVQQSGVHSEYFML